MQRTISKGKGCTMVESRIGYKNGTTSVLYAKWHINTTIDTSFSIYITKSDHLLFRSISFSKWDGYQPYFCSCQNMAHGLVKLRNIQSYFFFVQNKKNIVSHIKIYLQMCIIRLVNLFGHCDVWFEFWQA